MSVSTFCVDCGNKKTNAILTGSYQCEPCRIKLIDRLNASYRNVERDEEKRIDFLLRRAKELGINKTKKDIKNMIYNGYADWQILNNKKLHVWTWGNGNSKKEAYYYH